MNARTPDLDVIAAAARQTGGVSPSFVSASATTVAGHHAEVFAVSSEGVLLHRWWYEDCWSDWHTMTLRRGERASHVAAGAHDCFADLFVVTTDGQLLHRWWGPEQGWSTWSGWGAGFSGPATVASQRPDHNEIWIIRNGVFSHRWLSQYHEWSAWQRFV